MTLRIAFLLGAILCLLMSALVYITNAQMTALFIVQGRFILSHPWLLTVIWLLVSIGLILHGLITLIRMPNGVRYVHLILIGVYLLISGPSAIQSMIKTLEHQVQNPEIVRQMYSNLAQALLVAAIVLLVSSAVTKQQQ